MRNKGFTLIELSVTLVIIGLIIGGLLIGQDLIIAAKMRQQMKTLEEFDLAVNIFKLKYNDAIPGDMTITDAAMFGLPYAANAQSSGNNYHDGGKKLSHYTDPDCSPHATFGIRDLDCTYAYRGEPNYFFVQLYAAGLSSYEVTNDPTNLTTSAIKMQIGEGYIYPLSTPFGDNGYFLGMGTSVTSHQSLHINAAEPSFTSQMALQIDSKFDDGAPDSGRIMPAYVHGGWTIAQNRNTAASYDDDCVIASGSTFNYDLTTTPNTNECQLWVKGSW